MCPACIASGVKGMAVHTQEDEIEEKLRIVSADPQRDLTRIFRALLREVKPVGGRIKRKKRPRRYADALDIATGKFILESRGLYLRTQYKEGTPTRPGYHEQTIKMELNTQAAKGNAHQKALARREFKDEIPSLRPSLSAIAAPEIRALLADTRTTSLMEVFTARVSRRYFTVLEKDQGNHKGKLEIAFDHGYLFFPFGKKIEINEIEIELKDAKSHKYPAIREAMRNRIISICQRLDIKIVPENDTKGQQGFNEARQHMGYYREHAKKMPHWKRDKPRK